MYSTQSPPLPISEDAVKAGPVARCLYSRDFNAKLYNGGDEQRWHHARDDDDDDDGRVLPALNLCGLP